MKKLFKKYLRFLGSKFVPYSAEHKSLFGSHIPPADEFTVHNQDGSIEFKKIGLTLNIKKYRFFCKAFQFVRQLHALCGARFWLNDKDELMCTIKGVTIYLQTAQDISTLREIFIKGCYNLTSTEEYILIGIGLNVGITSLFFSSDPKCISTFSYEPFLETYQQAMANIKLNGKSL